MAPHPGQEADHIKEQARAQLLNLLEGVSCSSNVLSSSISKASDLQVRGKKNLVIGRALAGPVGLFVKFSTLQEYGVDRVFLLENRNVDSAQRNVVFLINAEKATDVQATAGK